MVKSQLVSTNSWSNSITVNQKAAHVLWLNTAVFHTWTATSVVQQNSKTAKATARVRMPYYSVWSGAGSRASSERGEGGGGGKRLCDRGGGWWKPRAVQPKAPTHDTAHNCSLSRTGSHSCSPLLHVYLNTPQLQFNFIRKTFAHLPPPPTPPTHAYVQTDVIPARQSAQKT